MQSLIRTSLVGSVLVLLLLGAQAAPVLAATPGLRCERGVSSAVARCVTRVNSLVRRCYSEAGGACATTAPIIVKAVASLERSIHKHCPDAAAAQAAGYGAQVDPDAVVDRAREACLGEGKTIAARTFGGPHGSLLVGASTDVRSCLDTAFLESTRLLSASLRLHGRCIRKAHSGGSCNTASIAAQESELEARAATSIAAACPALDSLLKISPATYAARTTAQARCLTATSYGDSGPLDLGCGPRAAVSVPARGQWVKVTLDGDTWGTRCGDGSDYAFWLRLAPAGFPVENVVTDMQGGGVCIFENDCANVSPGLFRADEGQPGGGYLSLNPSVNPFSNWTMLFMPYCTQDLHIGGGGTTQFTNFSVQRFGGVNARAALRYLRDVLWTELEASDPGGWHPDRLEVMFAGESAGGFGVMYNYHDALDELRWVNTTAVPDSGLALDSGGVGVLIQLVNSTWNVLPMLPPYCTANDCFVGPVIENATSPRLLATPFQQILNLSNQVDTTQRSTTAFPDLVTWINTLRTTYCTERGKNGLEWFLPASSTPIHTMLRSDSLFTGLTAGGVSVRDYVFGAMTDPAAVEDRVDEGTLVTDRPGVNPFACALPGP